MYSCFHTLSHHSRYQIICISQTHPNSIPNSLHPIVYCCWREQRTPHNITPAFPKGNMAWENIWGKLDFLSLDPACYSRSVFGMRLWRATPASWKILCFKNVRTNFTLPIDWHKVLDVRNNRLALQIVAIFKRVTYILCGSNRNTLYI